MHGVSKFLQARMLRDIGTARYTQYSRWADYVHFVRVRVHFDVTCNVAVASSAFGGCKQRREKRCSFSLCVRSFVLSWQIAGQSNCSSGAETEGRNLARKKRERDSCHGRERDT